MAEMKNKNYLTEEEVKEYLWKEFKKFMKGQTVTLDKKGKYLYFKWDVDNVRFCGCKNISTTNHYISPFLPSR